MKKITDFDLYNKKVIIRVDFNVPIKDAKILDDNRIVMSLKTINYAIENKAKVILLSHLGRVKTEEDKIKNSLKIVSLRLSELLNKEVIFSKYTRGKELEDMINNLSVGDVLLVENTRFEDLNGNLESGNDPALGKYWASLGDIFINDAFGTVHRSHASNVGIAANLVSGIGFLMEKELEVLNNIKTNPKRPYTVILGGAKVSDKIGVIDSLVKIADYILIGGGMSYTFLYALGYDIGKSIIDMDAVDYCKNLLSKYKDKLILPKDHVVASEISDSVKAETILIEETKKDDIGLDIGPKTISLFENYLDKSKTVVWNGTVGFSEYKSFEAGTKYLLDYLSKSKCDTIICGGDTASSAINFGYKDSFKHISTGGGASLELLEGKNLPGVQIIEK